MADTSKTLVKKYEDLSGKVGEFETREGVDSNGDITTQVWNSATGSLVAEVQKGKEDLLLNDPLVVPHVEHTTNQGDKVQVKDGEVVDTTDDSKSAKTEKTDEEKAADAEKKRLAAEKKAEKEAKEKEAADAKAKADADKARANGGGQ